MHPYLENDDLEPKEKIQKYFHENVTQKIREKPKGEGFIRYKWFPRDSPETEIEKISYVKRFSPWGWYLGTGLNLEEEKAQIALLIRQQLFILLGALLFIVLVYLFVLWQAKNTENKLSGTVKALEASERKYRDLFEKSGDASILINRNLIIKDCNAAGLKLLGCEKLSDIVDKHVNAFWPERQDNGEYSTSVADDILKDLFSFYSKRFEWLFERKDGSFFYGEILLTLLDINGEAMIHGVIRDITMRKENEKKILEYQEHLEELIAERTKELEKSNGKLNQELEEHKKLENDIRQILNSSDSAMRVIDLDQTIVYANEKYAKMIGVCTEDIIGSKADEVAADGENEGQKVCNLQSLLDEDGAFEYETQKTSSDGEKKTFILTCSPYIDTKGEIVGVLENYKDITERVMIEETQRKMALNRGRMDMANNILHDIGNAVTGIGSASIRFSAEHEWKEILSINQLSTFFKSRYKEFLKVLGEDKTEQLMKYLEALVEALEHREKSSKDLFSKVSKSISHINAILDMQRLYAKGDYVNVREFDIRKVIDDALFMMSSCYEKRKIQVITKYPHSEVVVNGDHTRLMQVFLNALMNCSDAFDESGKGDDDEKYLKIIIEESPDSELMLIVFEDNATGFEPELAEKFFERGYSSKHKGSGLGLHECRSIIESHGGSIRMRSEGKGTKTELIIELSRNIRKNKK
jgi:PAS domain S-box-containing protein